MWKIKHENTAWHSNVEDDDDFDIPDMDDLKGASHDAYLMNQRITSETFRYKFLNYNRSWLVNRLPSMLTPRTLKRSRPYLINQFSRILNQLNRDISSDSEDDSPDYGPVALSATSRKIIRWWLAKARKQVHNLRRLKTIVYTEPTVCVSHSFKSPLLYNGDHKPKHFRLHVTLRFFERVAHALFRASQDRRGNEPITEDI